MDYYSPQELFGWVNYLFWTRLFVELCRTVQYGMLVQWLLRSNYCQRCGIFAKSRYQFKIPVRPYVTLFRGFSLRRAVVFSDSHHLNVSTSRSLLTRALTRKKPINTTQTQQVSMTNYYNYDYYPIPLELLYSLFIIAVCWLYFIYAIIEFSSPECTVLQLTLLPMSIT